MKTLSTLFKNNVREYGMLIALIAVMAFFQFQTNGVLMKPVNITNLVLQNSYVITMALGMLLIIITGWIDLSVGSVVAVIGALAGVLIVRYDFNWVLVVTISLLLGAAIGWNALTVALSAASKRNSPMQRLTATWPAGSRGSPPWSPICRTAACWTT